MTVDRLMGIRWTIGNVAPAGFEALRLAVWGAWKIFGPDAAYTDRWELSFDNDCILWEIPPSIRRWLNEGDPRRCLIAADVRACNGVFAPWVGEEPHNAGIRGIRGIPPDLDLAETLRGLLRENPVVMTSELDEQGLQVAAVSRRTRPRGMGIAPPIGR